MNIHRLSLQPTRVNTVHLGGPLYHFDRITDEQLRQLGVDFLPGHNYGNTIRRDGITARRLRDGSMNVIVESTAAILRDRGYESFRDTLLDSELHGDYETVPGGLDDLEMPTCSPSRSTHLDRAGAAGWTYDIAADQFLLSERALDIVRAVMPGASAVYSLEDCLRGIHADDVREFASKLHAAIDGAGLFDIEYRKGSGRLHVAGTVMRDPVGRALRIVGVVRRSARTGEMVRGNAVS